MKRTPEEFNKKQITTSREEVAEVIARIINRTLDNLSGSDDVVSQTRLLLSVFGATIIDELFDDTLEVMHGNKEDTDIDNP